MAGLWPMTTIQDAIDRLVRCGVVLRADFDLDVMLDEWADDVGTDLDDAFSVLCALGGENGAVNLFHFDAECIEDHGDYARIAMRLAEMAAGDLPLEDVEDVVDIEGGAASLTFTLDGQRHEWQLAVEDDWADPSLFSRLAALLETRGTKRRFAQIDAGGQDCVFGYFSEDERRAVARETGLELAWLR